MMKRVAAWVLVLGACGSPQTADLPPNLSRHLPATLEADRPREGDPRTVTVRVWADPAVRALPGWRDEITEQLDYASQLLTPLVGARLQIEGWREWDRVGDPHGALRALAEADDAADVTWVIGYVAPAEVASTAMSELGSAQLLGRHVVVRAYAEQAETTALTAKLPDLGEAQRAEVLAAHRRHKQTVVLLHMLATTLGGIPESDPAWILHPSYTRKQRGFAARTTELLTLALDERLAAGTDQAIARKLLESIEASEWGGWLPAHKEEITRNLRAVLDAARAGKTASDIPAAAYDHVTRIKELARRGDTQHALTDLDNLLAAYPGNASMHLLKCELLLGRKAGATDPATRAACSRVSELAPGDPSPHLAVARALATANDAAGARAELVLAEGKIGNLPAGAADAWRDVIGLYTTMDALTWAEDALARAALGDPRLGEAIATTRMRYGVPRDGKAVQPADEGALIRAVKAATGLINAGKLGEADRALASAARRWPRAPGIAAARCDLRLRMGQLAPARAACQQALASQPDASWALYLAGVIALRTPSGTKAGIAHLQRAITVDPGLAQAWRALAKAYERAGDQAALSKLATDYQARFGQPLR